MDSLARLMLLAVAASVPVAGTRASPPNASLIILPHETSLVVGDHFTFNLTLEGELAGCVNVTFDLTKKVGEVLPFLQLCPESQSLEAISWSLPFNATKNGKATLSAQTFPPGIVQTQPSEAFALVSVTIDPAINVVGDVLGWIYTIAWDASFLPQIVHNWRRKSVVGLSFDFLAFNFLGFFSYFIFNMGLLWIDEIKAEYFERNPRSVLHVRVNDVIFPLYALVCTALQIVQCFYYQREPGQRVSTTCRIIFGVLVTSAVAGCVAVPFVDSLLWLDLLYWLSYIKLIITCIKYTPQLWMNYRRKNTEGWSIYQVILDFTGGSLSLIQMILLSYNYDDWLSMLRDPAKLGLGVLSIFFNIFFFMQHYCLYRNTPDRNNRKNLQENDTIATADQQYQTDFITHM